MRSCTNANAGIKRNIRSLSGNGMLLCPYRMCVYVPTQRSAPRFGLCKMNKCLRHLNRSGLCLGLRRASGTDSECRIGASVLSKRYFSFADQIIQESFAPFQNIIVGSVKVACIPWVGNISWVLAEIQKLIYLVFGV